jgi:hypothetical protein
MTQSSLAALAMLGKLRLIRIFSGDDPSRHSDNLARRIEDNFMDIFKNIRHGAARTPGERVPTNQQKEIPDSKQHLQILVRDNWKKASMKRILIVLAVTACIAGLGVPAAVRASASQYSTYCGSWDPNPGNDMRDVTTNYEGAGPDSSVWLLLKGTRIENGLVYYWAELTHGKPGDQIAFLWEWNNNGDWYQCGNAQADRTATVAPGNSVTWTSAVPASSIVDYDCQLWAVNNTTSIC